MYDKPFEMSVCLCIHARSYAQTDIREYKINRGKRLFRTLYLLNKQTYDEIERESSVKLKNGIRMALTTTWISSDNK